MARRVLFRAVHPPHVAVWWALRAMINLSDPRIRLCTLIRSLSAPREGLQAWDPECSRSSDLLLLPEAKKPNAQPWSDRYMCFLFVKAMFRHLAWVVVPLAVVQQQKTTPGGDWGSAQCFKGGMHCASPNCTLPHTSPNTPSCSRCLSHNSSSRRPVPKEVTAQPWGLCSPTACARRSSRYATHTHTHTAGAVGGNMTRYGCRLLTAALTRHSSRAPTRMRAHRW